MINLEEAEVSRRLEAAIKNHFVDIAGRDLSGRGSPARIETRKALINPNDELALERIIGQRDLMSINYLHRGMEAAKPVCRIRVRDRHENPYSFGTGFLVAPGLLLTNNHVLNSAGVAANSLAEFNVELDRSFVEKVPRQFQLRPDKLFYTKASLDYTFVAVSSFAHDDTPLDSYGSLNLIGQSGKAVDGECVSLIQHPGGGLKQIVIRENRVVVLDDEDFLSGDVFIHYTSDTEPGSSGAPVMNDQWDVVALHHKAIARFDEETGNTLAIGGDIWQPSMGVDQIDWVANEGVRISAIFDSLRQNRRDTNAERVLFELAVDTVRAYRIGSSMIPMAGGDDVVEASPFEATQFTDVDGYDADFLDSSIPLPTVVGGWADDVTELKDGGTELTYRNFSVVMSTSRRLAFLTAVNIDGKKLQRPTKKPSWRIDSRIDADLQLDNTLYKAGLGETFDIQRGHLVRRLDPVWGNMAEVNEAVDHTYHYTNAAPQGKSFNNTVWGDLEDYILKRALDTNHRVTVFSGPVFDDEHDPFYRDAAPGGPFQIPLEYWKVVVFMKPGNVLSATAYKQGQPEVRDWVEAKLTDAGFRPISEERRRLAQLRISELEELTSIDFGNLKKFDPMGLLEATVTERPIVGPEDILI